jgi:ubiquinone/menaquinone biosynthesis C-methylase UbiE
MHTQTAAPSPEHFFNAVFAYQQSAIIKGAIELDVFTPIAEGHTTASALAEKCQASERGIRILCDHLTVLGFLTKTDGQYGLTPDTAMFLDRRSPAYIGGAIDFLQSPMLLEAFSDIAATVRKGTTLLSAEGSVTDENPVWIRFAHAMMPLMMMPAQMIAQLVKVDPQRQVRVLDIAAGHGIFGIAFAQAYPNVEVTAVDWAPVLDVAKENAQRFGVADRYRTLPGSAFEVEFGAGYDLVLLTNFLHHFDTPTNEKLLRKLHAALNEGGRAVTYEFVPNDDRVTPPGAAAFAMVMLASTPAGDAYTFAEFEKMFGNAGFTRSEIHPLPPTLESVVISHK